MSHQPAVVTASAGNPVADNQDSLTAGPRGPWLMQDCQLLEELAHRNRERMPERTVHANGTAAYTTLAIAQDIGEHAKAVSR